MSPAAIEMPDVPELFEAMREAVQACDAYNAAHPEGPKTTDDEAGRRLIAAVDRLRALMADCDQALAAFSGEGATDA